MKIRTFSAAIAFVFALSGAAWAETKADAFGLGKHDPAPEKTGKIGNDISIRVRLIRDKTGELAAAVRKGETVSVELAYYGAEGGKDRPVSLVCYAQFIDTEAEKSAMAVSGRPCFEGQLHDSYGRFVPLDMSLKFHPDASDPAGTYGVVVKVEDSVTGKHIVLLPTYDWQDGTK